MRDGWFARFRGLGWGRKQTPPERVEWHEIKTGIFYLHKPAARTDGGRGLLIADQRGVCWGGEPLELGRRWHDQALRGGRAQSAADEGRARAWVEPRLHRLRHGKEKAVWKEIAALKPPRGPAGEDVRKPQNYFAGPAGRMNYEAMARRGWPIGSGPVESTGRQDQCRFKRTGQFWTQRGFCHLRAPDEARHNGSWDALWLGGTAKMSPLVEDFLFLFGTLKVQHGLLLLAL